MRLSSAWIVCAAVDELGRQSVLGERLFVPLSDVTKPSHRWLPIGARLVCGRVNRVGTMDTYEEVNALQAVQAAGVS